jgi:diguanylate cyclase (GGDEF)-like protein/PAS domain S-box-containing protein
MTEAVARPKILVVDDQPANLLAASKILAKLPVDVITAKSGNEALSLLLRHELAAILLDVRMPIMDGYETATLIRSHTGQSPVPIIFVTAEASEQRQVFQGYESGAVDYLLKPIDETLLVSKLRVFLDLYEHRRRLTALSAHLQQSNQRLEKLLQAVGDGIVGVEEDGTVGFVNPAACRMLDGAPAQLRGRPATELFAQAPSGIDDPFGVARKLGVHRQSVARFRTVRGAELPVEYVLSAIESGFDDGRKTFVLVFQDIADRLTAEKALRRQAEIDHLTGLANRLIFEQSLAQMVGRPGGANRPFSVMLLDLDGFKKVNDTFGHAVGDFLLKGVAQRMRETLRAGDIPARLGGDEFAALLEGARDAETAMAIGAKVAASLSEPYDCGGTPLTVGASVGVAVYPEHGQTVEMLVRAADDAMYRAKRQQGSTVMLAQSATVSIEEAMDRR